MARFGVTYKDIAQAANHLLEQGKQPTIELIRHILGTGSSTTIAQHLRQWRAERDGTIALSPVENLPAEMLHLVQDLWEKLQEKAQEKIAAMEIQYKQTYADIERQLLKYKNNNQRWQKLFNHWVKEKDELSLSQLNLAKIIEILKIENSALKTRLELETNQLREKIDYVNELTRLHTFAQENFKSYQNDRFLKQKRFTYEIETLQTKTKKQEEDLRALEKEKIILQQTCEHHQTECHEYKKLSEIKSLQLADIQIEFKILSKELIQLKEKYSRLENKIKIKEKVGIKNKKLRIQKMPVY